MTRRVSHICSLLLAVVLLAAAVPSAAQTHLRGELGVDLENARFHNSLKDTAREYTVNRSLSSHYLDLRLEGPLVNPNFADYSARAKLFGTFYRASAEAGEENMYIDPSVPTYAATLSMFPARPYPLLLNYQKSRNHSLRYESNNRSKIDLISPELTVVRRYQSDVRSMGGLWKFGFTSNLDLTTEVKDDETQISRNYDFGEDKDIWAVFTLIREDLSAPEHTIIVQNTIIDDTVIVFVDLDSVVSIPPAGTVTFPLDGGTYEIDFIPLNKNPYSKMIDVRGDMVWQVVFTPPATPNDLDQKAKSGTALLRYGDNGRFSSESYYSYSDTREAVQRMTTYLNLFSNTASYELSRSVKFNALTTFNQNDMTIADLTDQLAKNLTHQTGIQFTQKRGLSASLSHTYGYMSNRTAVDTLLDTVISNSHIVANNYTYPVDKWGYTADLRNSMNLLSDNGGYVNNQYSTELGNQFDWHWRGVDWVPRSQVKYSYKTQKSTGEPDQNGSEIETKHSLSATVPNLERFGKLQIRGEHDYRSRDVGKGKDIQNRYFLDITLRRSFGKAWKLMLTTTQEKETYGGEVASASGAGGIENPARENQIKTSYKIDLQAAPWDDFSLGVNAMTIGQAGSRISRVGFSLSAEIPRINIPVRSFLQAESRELEGLPKQTNLQTETRLSYRFREISIVVTYSYTRENLLTETYSFQEIRGKISRNFGIF